MSKARLIIIAAFVLTLAAGVAAGFVLRAITARPPDRWGLEHDLKLTAEQSAKMRTIWSEAMRDPGRSSSAAREAARKQRDEALRALLTDEQKPLYDALLQDYSRKMAELSKAREARFQQAVARTKQILTPEQCKAYDVWIKERLDREHRRPGGPREQSRPEAPKAEGGAASGGGT